MLLAQVEAQMGIFRRRSEGLLAYETVLDALGRDHDMGSYNDEVELSAILGSVARTDDFDRGFRPRRHTSRLDDVRRKFDEGGWPPPIRLFRLGELYFVVDGHHRVAVARERNWATLPAQVRRVCTVAYARACLSNIDLAASAAERRFLEQLPLADGVREANWLHTPADWSRIADSAMAWGLRRQLADGTTYCCATDLAAAWWETEVMPVVGSWRQHAADDTTTDLPDLQVFLAALAHRDCLGTLDWADPANEYAPCR